MSPSALADTLDDPRRLVALDGVHNFRDLGGYPTADGHVTRWGLLYRADGLYRLTDDDVEVIRSLGLRTVVDLRSAAELDERGTFPTDRVPVDFAHHPVIDTTWQIEQVAKSGSDAEFLVFAYREMLAAGADRFAGAIEQLARPGALPAVFHCAAGKDRTGLLAALVLECVGVPRSVVLGDYALTAAGMARMQAWARREHPELASVMADTPSAFMAALPESLGRVLDEVTAEHGSVREFVRSIGVADESVARLRAALLAPAAG
jgi:protein-tyrosine phosphatase